MDPWDLMTMLIPIDLEGSDNALYSRLRAHDVHRKLRDRLNQPLESAVLECLKRILSKIPSSVSDPIVQND